MKLVTLALVAAAVSNVGAQATHASLAPASKLWIEGTSNVHNWECTASTVDAAIDIDAAGLAAAPEKLVKKVSMKVPVKSLKCGHGKMDENLQKALNADKSPDIA